VIWLPYNIFIPPEKTTDLSHVTDKLYYIMLYGYTSPWTGFEHTILVVIGTVFNNYLLTDSTNNNYLLTDSTNNNHLLTDSTNNNYLLFLLLVWFRVFNATFNTISVISGRSVLLVGETGVPGENYRPVACHWQTLLHNVIFIPLILNIF
jgi:hypothetical protein